MINLRIIQNHIVKSISLLTLALIILQMKNKLIKINKKIKFQQFLIRIKDLDYFQKTNKKILTLQTI